ncbi:MAG: MATE family efflux transporter [Rhodobacteraceae bacterium]|nr:MATE family efflux transporter [Paracoccaceae bacterium]
MRALLRLGLPLVGGHLAQFAIGMTDAAMLGWYSVEALAAVVLGATLFLQIFILGSGFAMAVMPMVAEAQAQGNQVLVRRIARMGLWLSLGYALASLPIFWFSGAVLIGLGQDAELALATQGYLRIAGFGILPALLVMVLKSYLAALEHTRAVLWITVLAALINVAANYALIFGHWGAPELGLAGAALGSIVVQVVSLVGAVGYALYALPAHRLFHRLWRADTEILRKVFHLGVPIGLTGCAEAMLFAMATMMMGWLGKIPLAAHGIAINLAGATFMIHLGLSNAATVRVGNALGRRDADHMARGAAVACLLSVLVSGCVIAAFLLIPEALIGLFLAVDEPKRDAIMAAGVALLTVAALFQLVDGAQVVALGLLRGVMDTRIPMWIAVVSYLLIGVPCAYGLGFRAGWGGVGVWLGFVVGLSVAGIWLMWRFWGPKLRALRVAWAQEAHR